MTRGGATKILTGAAFLFLAAIFAVSQYRDLTRAPSVDEAEYLHGAARMARGDRIFVDFVEHHPPLFFSMVSMLAGPPPHPPSSPAPAFSPASAPPSPSPPRPSSSIVRPAVCTRR